MTYIFTFHPLISCLPAIDYLACDICEDLLDAMGRA